MSSSISIQSSSNTPLRITLDRPSKLNALNLEMVRELGPVISTLKPNSIFLLEGSGDRAFCSGGDVASIREAAIQGQLSGPPSDFFFEEYHLDYWLSQLRTEMNVTQISIWNGVCMGGGVGISIHGAIRIATEKTLFAMPEVSIGLFPDVGATYALPRLKAGKEVGLYLATTGVRLGAKDCLWAGLATHYLPSDRLATFRDGLKSLGSTSNENQVSELIDSVRNGAEPPPSKTTPLEDSVDAIKECFCQNSMEETLQKLQEIGANSNSKHSTWANNTIKSIRAASPLSVKLTHEVLKRNGRKEVSLLDAFAVEYRLTQYCVRPQPYSDFLEGVRAVLIDRDRPTWSHKSIEDVSMEKHIEPFFGPLPKDHPRGEFKGNIRKELLKQ